MKINLRDGMRVSANSTPHQAAVFHLDVNLKHLAVRGCMAQLTFFVLTFRNCNRKRMNRRFGPEKSEVDQAAWAFVGWHYD